MRSAEKATGVGQMTCEGERTGVLETTGVVDMTLVETIDGQAMIAVTVTTGGAVIDMTIGTMRVEEKTGVEGVTEMMTESKVAGETIGAEDMTEMMTDAGEIEWTVVVETTGVELRIGVGMMIEAGETIDEERTADRHICHHTGVEEMKEETTEEQTVLGAEGVRRIGVIDLVADKCVRILDKSRRRKSRNGRQTLQTMRRSTKLHWPRCRPCQTIQVSSQGL